MALSPVPFCAPRQARETLSELKSCLLARSASIKRLIWHKCPVLPHSCQPCTWQTRREAGPSMPFCLTKLNERPFHPRATQSKSNNAEAVWSKPLECSDITGGFLCWEQVPPPCPPPPPTRFCTHLACPCGFCGLTSQLGFAPNFKLKPCRVLPHRPLWQSLCRCQLTYYAL